ncbi:MAG: alpha/beta hydrolase [Lysobacteraceae bacterium]|nr:MAG: alpha/beta hydrolase [Xanthomonadaceae bacterium]
MPDRIVFSHANGFPLPVYRRVLDALGPDFECTGVQRFGHDPSRPVTLGWPYLVDELTEFVCALPSANGRLWLVGHSLGGYLSVLAAQRLPGRVAGIVLLDSPLFTGLSSAFVKFGRWTGLDRLVMPLRQTLQRRWHWPDHEAVHAHYAAKPAFARWNPQVLRDYTEHCTVPDGRGRRELLFDRNIEYRIYRSLPTDQVRAALPELKVPIAFIGGRDSYELRSVGLRTTRAVVGPRLYWIEGSHLFPMEAPEQTAAMIRRAAEAITAITDHAGEPAA